MTLRKTYIILSVIGLTSCKIGYKSSELFKNKDSEKLFFKASKLSSRRDYNAAIYYFNKADSIGPNTPAIIHERGLAKMQNGDTTGGFIDINRSIALEKDSNKLRPMLANRADYYYDYKLYEQACSDCKAAGHYCQKEINKYCK